MLSAYGCDRDKGARYRASCPNQIGTLDKRRLIERWGSLEPETMQRVDEALKISIGLVPL